MSMFEYILNYILIKYHALFTDFIPPGQLRHLDHLHLQLLVHSEERKTATNHKLN
jgi:hypothetical protein